VADLYGVDLSEPVPVESTWKADFLPSIRNATGIAKSYTKNGGNFRALCRVRKDGQKTFQTWSRSFWQLREVKRG
jgi:hypothetical protein